MGSISTKKHFTEKGISLLNPLTFVLIYGIMDTYCERKMEKLLSFVYICLRLGSDINV